MRYSAKGAIDLMAWITSNDPRKMRSICRPKPVNADPTDYQQLRSPGGGESEIERDRNVDYDLQPQVGARVGENAYLAVERQQTLFSGLR